ncbi:MAG: DUF2207 domain-containing protein [Vicinamibacterales bacterium]
MRDTIRTALSTVAAVLLLALTASPADAMSYFAERFDALIRVLPGGSLEVTETVAFRFESGTFDHVYRELPARRTDGIEVVSASMDGRPFPVGEGVDHVEISGGSKKRVEWHFARVSESTHVFVLTYIARGVVIQADGADLLEWRALPREHQYRIDASTIEYVLPAGAVAGDVSAATPRTETHRLDGEVTVSMERGPEDVTAPPVRARLTASRIRENGWVEQSFRLPRGSVISAPPAWQQSALTAAAFAPRWITAAAVLVFAGLILLFGLRQQYDAPSVDRAVTTTGGAVPDALPPALAGALVANGRAEPDHAMGTLFALADRGIVSIEEQPRRFGTHNFEITHRQGRSPQPGHESVLLGLLFDQNHPERTSLSKARGRLTRRFKQFSAAVQQELATAGLLNLDRQHLHDRFMTLGVAFLIMAGLAVPLAALFVSRFDGWPMLLPAALVVVGVASFIAAASVTPLSNEGVRRAARWRAFRGDLKDMSQHSDQPAARNLGALLPFAVATGLSPYLARYLKKHPGSVPAWFRALSAASPDGAFTAFVGSSAAHGGAGGGGGAAGGGGSGAG